MRRALYVVRTPDYEDEAPASDRTLIQPSSHELPAVPEHVPDSVTAANAAAFDDLPTIVKASPTSEPSVHSPEATPWREQAPPSIQVNESAPSYPLPPMSPEEKASFFSREQVTRLEAPPAPLPSVPQPTWSDPTAPGAGRALASEVKPRVAPVRIAMGIAGALCLLMGLLARQKNHVAPATAIRPATSASATAAGSLPASAAAVTTAQTNAAAPAPSAAPDVSGGSDEVAAVEAVESGDLPRAARMYAALSAAHPTNEAYREAARILREGTKESRP